MPDQKRDETSNVIFNLIVLFCFVTCCMLYTVGLETLAQESAERESSLTTSKIESASMVFITVLLFLVHPSNE